MKACEYYESRSPTLLKFLEVFLILYFSVEVLAIINNSLY